MNGDELGLFCSWLSWAYLSDIVVEGVLVLELKCVELLVGELVC
jgi:hypothetical protein